MSNPPIIQSWEVLQSASIPVEEKAIPWLFLRFPFNMTSSTENPLENSKHFPLAASNKSNPTVYVPIYRPSIKENLRS